VSDNNAIIEDRPLYALLVRGLPSFHKTRTSGAVRLRISDIAASIDMAPQGIYKRFEPGAERNTITIGMARKLIKLSAEEAGKEGVPANFQPLTIEDFDPYLT
jgi:hypothetical protein